MLWSEDERGSAFSSYANSVFSGLALQHASPNLHEQLLGSGSKDSAVLRLQSGLFKYLNRNANRTVPFGLFVAHRAYLNDRQCAESAAGDLLKLKGDYVSIGTASNLLWHLQCHSASKPDPSEALGLNPIINSFPGTYTWVYTPDRVQGITQNMRLKPSPVILELVTLLSKVQCLPRSVIATHLSSTFPNVNPERVGEFLSQLTEIEFLQVADKSDFDIDASMSKFDVDVFNPIGSQAVDVVSSLRETLDSAELLRGKASESHHRESAFVEVCLSDETEVHLNKLEIGSLTEAVNIIIATSSRVPEFNWSLEDWCSRFIEKYGMGHPVSLVSAVNPYKGIGPILGYLNPAPSNPEFPRQRTSVWRRLDLDLRIKMLTKIEDHHGVPSVNLKQAFFDDCLEAINANYLANEIYPDLDFSIQVSEIESEKAFLFRSDSVALGGHSFTRSRRTMSRKTSSHWIRVLDNLAIDQGIDRSTHLVSQPSSAVVDYLVPKRQDCCLSTSTEVSSAGVPFSQLYLMGTPEGVQVGTIDDRGIFKRHVINFPSLVLPLAFKNEARIAIDLSRANYRIPACFSWAQLEESSFLPEVRYGLHVLRPAEWRLTADMISAAQRTLKHNDPEHLRRSLTASNIQDNLFFASGDHRLHFDVNSNFSLIELARLIKASEPSERLERSSLDGTRGLRFANHQGVTRHSTEMILSFSRRCRSIKGQYSSSFVENAAEEHFEENWVTLTLLTTPDAQHRLIKIVGAESVRALEQGLIDQWFFVRYHDNGCSVRLRWRFPLMSVLLDKQVQQIVTLGQEMALIRGWYLSEYNPEFHRYGKGSLLELCHEVFTLSTELSTRILLELPDESTGVELEIAVISMVELIALLGVPWSYIYDVLPRVSKPSSQARAIWSRSNLDLCKKASTVDRLTRPTRNAIFDALQSLCPVSLKLHNLILDLLHMHSNRLHSSGDSFEDDIYWLLRQVIHKHRFLSD